MSARENHLVRMKYAFAMHLVKNVIEADSVVMREERDYFQECFPDELRKSLSLENEKECADLVAEALVALPKMLSLEERLDLFGMFLGASVSDGELEFREFGVLEVAAGALDIPSDIVMEYFDRVFEAM